MTTRPPTDAITIRPPPTSVPSESMPPPSPVVGGKALIHGKGEVRLDRVLDFVSFVTKPMPLSLLLDEAPKRIAQIVQADIVSLYLLEGDGATLVLRGNLGFSGAARGKVRLSVGEGLTGMAVECMRPVSAVQAPEHVRWRPFAEIEGESRYPVFLAVPILGHNRALGAIVVQRGGDRAFKPSDVRLLVSLTAPIASAVRHAQVLDELRDKNRRRTGGGTRKVTLPGVPVVSGRCLGAVAALRRPATSPTRKAGGEDAKLLRWAFETAEKALSRLVGRSQQLGMARDAAFLSNYLLMVSDERMRSRAFELIGEGLGVAQALGTVAREAVRAANGIVGDPFMQERARDMEDLCDALLMLASPDARAELPSKAVLIGDQLTVFDLLVSSRAHPVGVALTERSAGPRTQVLLKLLGVPAIIDTEGLFRWASPGDVVLIDADHGFLVINPSRAEMATLRAERRKEKTSEEEGEGAFDGDMGD
ncbi:GAF domain-containing protein [Polyangium aurulentum]|uniref:GAF domain-containing protein n=1 Tax=Polyangium aurulentum TaxID=2567896 RepID=UPI0010ADC55A|nr:GAF domain-containing protein [Polyangium aurulentum]UQA61120.1 GAF domain-containing protein [Polyangium aurulentum]